eukprot:GFUD01001358.1.p1 GENE.GFUD01001358.1~~GFUD01001358.1.p1  ORF type:complete len:397 (+),score=61.94 GFUD01001358.1:151-1341(+)
MRGQLAFLILSYIGLSTSQLVDVKKARNGICKTFSGDAGECVKERDCEDVLKGRYFPSFCSISGSRAVGVCCKLKEPRTTTTSTTTKTTTTTQRIRTTTKQDTSSRFSSRCGTINYSEKAEENLVQIGSISPRSFSRQVGETVGIVSGTDAVKGSQPWMAALGVVNPKDDIVDFLCGGSLLSDRAVLTSAHCLGDLGHNPLVFLGQNDLSKDGGVERRVRSVSVHPKWANLTGWPEYDLAILHLDKPVDISDSIMPICLPTDYFGIQERSIKPRYGVISGWGRLYSGGPRVAELQSAVVDILEDLECEAAYPHIFNRTDPPTDLLCGKGLEVKGRSSLVTDSCQGDSGGPLVVEQQDFNWTLVGVVAGGVGCGAKQYPGIYVKVAEHLQWIRDNVD